VTARAQLGELSIDLVQSIAILHHR